MIKFWFTYAVMLVIITLISYKVNAEEKTISWQAPTTRVDGTILKPEEIKGYDISYGSAPAASKNKLIDYTTNLSYKINLTGFGKYCFRGQTILKDSTRSAWSKEACITISQSLPKPPTLGIK